MRWSVKARRQHRWFTEHLFYTRGEGALQLDVLVTGNLEVLETFRFRPVAYASQIQRERRARQRSSPA